MMVSELSTLICQGRTLEIEWAWVGVRNAEHKTLVFLHEGLGSVAMWRDFPDRLCQQLGMRGLVYSRPGYGRSTPRARDEQWGPDFMHLQAHHLLPALLAQLGVVQPWVLGHSDGGSIALLYAARYQQALAGAIVLAPHIFVEDISVSSIRAAREAYLQSGLRDKLARYHNEVDSAFFGWNDIWLSPRFRSWNIESDLETITCPLLAIQGEDDEYGSSSQLHGIQARVSHAEILELAACGHSPQRDQPELLNQAVARFIAANECEIPTSGRL